MLKDLMKEIKRYALKIFGGPKGSGLGKRASIHLFDKDNRGIGRVDFWDAEMDLPADENSEMNGIILSLHAARMVNVVDMLRNEEPCFIAWQESIKNAYISTGQEPVGEGE